MKTALVMLSLAWTVSLCALTPAERRGRQIFRTGESASGRPILANEITASALPCGNCHGAEGKGVPEGTIVPADIRASVLAKYLVTSERRRGAYDDASLARVIRTGHDAGDNELSPVMPRYRMADEDLADLLAYLHRLGDEPQPGRADEQLTIATVVPLSGAHAATGERTRAVIDAYFADVNAAGGIHGRTLQLEVIDSTKTPARDLGGNVFAVVCASLAGAGEEVPAVVDDERIPLVTPLPFDASPGASPSSFFLFSDLESQTLALVRRAGDGPHDYHVLRGESPAARAAVTALEERAAALHWKRTETKKDDDLLFVIGADADAVVRDLRKGEWHPRLFVAGTPPGGLTEYGNDAAVAVPTLPADWSEEGANELRAFVIRHQLPTDHLAAQIAPYAAVKVFVEALKRAGRDVTREKLIATLEDLHQFPTGLTQPISYSRRRHTGAAGAFIVAVDREKRTLVSEEEWTRGD